jgi:hypothetical protein
MRNLLFAFMLVALIIVAPAFSNASTLNTQVNQMITTYWEANNALYAKDMKAYLSKNDQLREQANVISAEIIKGLKNNDNTLFNEYVKIYNELKSPETLSVLNMVADQVKEYSHTRDLTPGTNFPGYGYAEPGYVYRRGEELPNPQVLSVYWKKITKTYQKGTKFHVNVEVGANANFGGNADVKLVGKGTVNIGGQIKNVNEYEVTVNETTNTACTVKYQKKKVWYVLYKAKKSIWSSIGFGSYTWTKCGKTYVIIEEESGLPVIENPGQISPKN